MMTKHSKNKVENNTQQKRIDAIGKLDQKNCPSRIEDEKQDEQRKPSLKYNLSKFL